MKRLCIFCKHFYFYGGEPGYSDVTPGSDMDTGCHKDVWEWDHFLDFRDVLKNAQECNHYELTEDAREMGAPE